MPDAACGALIVCDGEGKIVRVRNHGLLEDGDAFAGAYFATLFSTDCMPQALDIMVRLPKEGFVAAGMLSLKRETRASGVMVSGFQDGRQSFLLLHAMSDSSFARGRASEDAFFREITLLNSELANARRTLVKQNIQLQQLSEEKDRMVGIVSHDLRNPLTSILGYSHLLMKHRREDDGSEAQMLRYICEASDYMVSIIKDFLDISMISLGKLHLNLEKSNLAEILNNVVAMDRMLAAPKNITIALDMPENMPAIRLDVNKIMQVANNLIANAIKFSPCGSGIDILVNCDGDALRVSVSDKGPGIPLDEQHKLFKPFSQTSIRGAGGEKGSGLGLSICSNIIKAHKGEIGCISEPGKGSTFWFSLPLAGSEGNPAKDE